MESIWKICADHCRWSDTSTALEFYMISFNTEWAKLFSCIKLGLIFKKKLFRLLTGFHIISYKDRRQILFLVLNELKPINPSHATNLFWYPLKTLENRRFSDVFRGYQKRLVV